jgi:hypothetical protein
MGSVVKYCEKKRTNPEIKSLVGKLPIVNVDEIMPEMLTIDDVPTEADVEAIRALSRDQRDCRDRIASVAKDHWPTQSATRKELAMKLDLVTAQLLKRNLSYGNANRLYQEAALHAEGKLTEDVKEQLAEARAHEAEAWRTIGDGIRAVAGAQKPLHVGWKQRRLRRELNLPVIAPAARLASRARGPLQCANCESHEERRWPTYWNLSSTSAISASVF